MASLPCICRSMAILLSRRATPQYGPRRLKTEDVSHSSLRCKRTTTFASMMGLVPAPGPPKQVGLGKQWHGPNYRYTKNLVKQFISLNVVYINSQNDGNFVITDGNGKTTLLSPVVRTVRPTNTDGDQQAHEESSNDGSVTLARRLVKLVIAIWMICDILMDLFTNYKYYEVAQVS